MAPGILRNLRIKRVALVDAGANLDKSTGDGAHIMLYKAAIGKGGPSVGSVHVDSPAWDADDQDEYEKSTLDASARSALSDADFAAVWTDADGKKHRKLPIHDAGHLAAARGRVDGASIPESVKSEAKQKIEAATNKEKPPVKKSVKDVFKSMMAAFSEPDVTKRAAAVAAVEKDVEGMQEPPNPPDPAAKPAVDPKLAALKETHTAMGKSIAAFGPGPHPPEHPVHAMAAAHGKIGEMLKSAGVECDTTPATGGPGTEPPADVAKGVKMDAEIAKQIEDIKKQNADLLTQLNVEKSVRQTTEMVTLLKSFKATPFVLEGDNNDVTRFMKMKSADPEGFERTVALLKAADETVAKSALFTKQYGSSMGGGAGDAWKEIETLAAAMVSKSATPLTKEAAIEKVCLDPANKEVVKRYREAQ